MKLNITLDTDDFYDEEGFDFEGMLAGELQKAVIKNCRDSLATDQFTKFADLTSDTVIADIKLRLENFLSEEIALTGEWGKKTFVGSLEDLIKKRFDDILLRNVDSGGKTIEGCTIKGTTWIEWRIKDQLENSLKRKIMAAQDTIELNIGKSIEKKLIEFKDKAIKDQVDSAFTKILKAVV